MIRWYSENNMELPRGFKGVWIPKDIWLAENLTTIEKVLFAEIDSLDTRGGCFAGNEHLSKFLGVSVVQVSRIISKLKTKGFIEVKQENIKGRTRRTITSALSFMRRRSPQHFGTSALTFKDIGDAQNDKPSISDTLSNTNSTAETSSAEIVKVVDLFKPLNPNYREWYGNKTQRKAIEQLLERYGIEKVSNMVVALPGIVSKKFAPKITTPHELKRDLGKLLIFIKQEGQGKYKAKMV